jgi:NAD-dependent SIR2 family protein deacetylase
MPSNIFVLTGAGVSAESALAARGVKAETSMIGPGSVAAEILAQPQSNRAPPQECAAYVKKAGTLKAKRRRL